MLPLLKENSGCFQLKKGIKTDVKWRVEGMRYALHDVLVPNKFQHYSLIEEQVDLLLCAKNAVEAENHLNDTVSK